MFNAKDKCGQVGAEPSGVGAPAGGSVSCPQPFLPWPQAQASWSVVRLEAGKEFLQAPGPKVYSHTSSECPVGSTVGAAVHRAHQARSAPVSNLVHESKEVVCCPCITGEETEAQRGEGVCPGSQGAELRWEPGSPGSPCTRAQRCLECRDTRESE